MSSPNNANKSPSSTLRRVGQRWQPENEGGQVFLTGLPDGAQPAIPGTFAGWDAQQDRWQPTTWFAPEAELSVIQPAAAAFNPGAGYPWQEQPAEWRPIVWFAPEASVEGLIPRVNAPSGLDLGWDAQLDRDRTTRWFQPDTEAWTPIPGLTVASVAEQAALWPERSQDWLPVRWFTPDDDTAPPFYGIPTGFNPATGFDWSEQPATWTAQRWFAPDASTEGLTPLDNAPSGLDFGWDAQFDRAQTIRWFQVDTEAWAPIPGLTVASVEEQAPLWPDQPAAWRPVVWFAPEASVEGLTPAPAFDPATGFDWSEQPAAWLPVRWFTPDDAYESPLPLASPLTPLAAELLAPLWPEQPAAWTAQLWFTPDASVEAPFQPAAAFDPAIFDWQEQPVHWTGQRWFAPESEAGGVSPLPNAPTHPDFGWDAAFDRSNAARWFTPEPYVESPEPLASPLTPLSAELLAGLWPDASGQQDRSLQPVWFAPDAEVLGAVPIEPPFDPATGFDWTDNSGQQDRSIQPVWRHPDIEWAPTATGFGPTTATVEEQAGLWQEQPAHWQDQRRIADAIEPWFMALNINLYAPAPGATPKVLINAENGDVFLYIGGNFIVPAS